MTRVVLLIKDFETAKQRLSPTLDIEMRRMAAVDFAVAALAAVGAEALVVAGSKQVAATAREKGNEVVVEERAGGQNPAARLGIEAAVAKGAGAVLLLSSDLPLIEAGVVARLLAWADGLPRPVVVAVPAIGRGGTNALYLAPPGRDRPPLRRRLARQVRGRRPQPRVRFETYDSPELALDVDEPSDLAAFRERRRAG